MLKILKVLATSTICLLAVPSLAKDITVVMSEEPNNLDPCNSSRNVTGRIIKHNVIETLVQRDVNGTLKNSLASNWTRVDSNTWKFTITKNKYFSNGILVSPNLVKLSLDRTLNSDIKCNDKNKLFAGIDTIKITAFDDYIHIWTNVPDSILPIRMSGIGISLENNIKMLPQRAIPIGSGSYTIDQWNDSKIELSHRINKQKVQYLWRAESSVRAAMVQIDEADIALDISYTDTNNSNIDYEYLNAETIYLKLDNELPIFKNNAFKKALLHSINLEDLIGTILPKNTLIAKQIITPLVSGYNPNIKSYEYDIATAKKYLDIAKTEKVDISQPIDLIVYAAQFPNANEVMEAIASMWRNIGLNINVIQVDRSRYTDYNTRKQVDPLRPTIQQTSHDNVFGDPVFSMEYKYGCEGATSSYCNRDLDTRIKNISSLEGTIRTLEWQNLMNDLYIDYSPYIMLYHTVSFVRISNKISYKPSILLNSELILEDIK